MPIFFNCLTGFYHIREIIFKLTIVVLHRYGLTFFDTIQYNTVQYTHSVSILVL